MMAAIKFITLGCKVNQYETQSMRQQLLNSGFKERNNGAKADVYLINTCTVTQKADSESLGFIRRAKRENPKAKIIVTGCLAELDSQKIRNEKVSLIIKNKDKPNILSFLRPAYHLPSMNYELRTMNYGGISDFKGHTRAFLKIQDGCNNFCSYCKVPLVRGISKSRPKEEIVQEARGLVKNGFKEIVLTGICLGSYGKDLKPCLNLLHIVEELEKINGLLRIRFSSIELKDINRALIKKIAASKKICRHLHIPLQSGDDAILKRMRRKYSRSDYLNKVQDIKKLIGGIAITTDVLVGFPGESENNFNNTVDLIKKIMPLKVHIFPYSRREGTNAALNFKQEIPNQIIRERLFKLNTLARECSSTYQKQFLGKNMAVLVEQKIKKSPGNWQGYTDNYLKIKITAKGCLKNKLIHVKLKKSSLIIN